MKTTKKKIAQSEVYGVVVKSEHSNYEAQLRFVENDLDERPSADRVGVDSIWIWYSFHTFIWTAKLGARRLVRRYEKTQAFNAVKA